MARRLSQEEKDGEYAAAWHATEQAAAKAAEERRAVRHFLALLGHLLDLLVQKCKH
jgi:hypothetical protein